MCAPWPHLGEGRRSLPGEGGGPDRATSAAYDRGVPYPSSPDLLVLHALRLMGMANDGSLTRRFGLDRALVSDFLLDYEARGWVQRVAFADLTGWTLTALGRDENARLIADELEATGVRHQVASVHGRFVPLNGRFLVAVTSWQIRPLPGEPLAANDHSDWRWDERVLGDLRSLLRGVRPLCSELELVLDRFRGYPARMTHALDMVDQGERSWVDRPSGDSLHSVWCELHEDLLATLAINRGDEDRPDAAGAEARP